MVKSPKCTKIWMGNCCNSNSKPLLALQLDLNPYSWLLQTVAAFNMHVRRMLHSSIRFMNLIIPALGVKRNSCRPSVRSCAGPVLRQWIILTESTPGYCSEKILHRLSGTRENIYWNSWAPTLFSRAWVGEVLSLSPKGEITTWENWGQALPPFFLLGERWFPIISSCSRSTHRQFIFQNLFSSQFHWRSI